MLKLRSLQIPRTVKVIKVNRTNKFWEEKTIIQYYYNMVDDRPVIYSFLNQQSAENCLTFLNHYKRLNLRYPNEEMSSIQKELIIDDETLVSMQERCSLAGVGLFGIKEFSYTHTLNYFQTDYIAEDLLLDLPDISVERHIENLNFLLDVN